MAELDIAVASPEEFVTVQLPPDYQDYYQRQELLAYRIYREIHGLSIQSSEIAFRLEPMLKRVGISTAKKNGLFFYTLGLNQRHSQYRMRADNPARRYYFMTNTPVTYPGKFIWYGRLDVIPAVMPDTLAHFDALTTGSKGFITDIAFFHAPSFTYLREM